MPRPLSLFLIVVCLVGSAVACQPLVVQKAPTESRVEDPVVRYLEFQRRLKSMDQDALDAAYKRVYDDFIDDATPDRRLRLALILSAPNNNERDESVAKDQLLRLLRGKEQLPSSVFDYVLLQLDELVYRSSLRAQDGTLEQEGMPAAAEDGRQIASLRARIRELEAELTEAERKIEGLRQIEESLDQTELENASP